MEAADGWVVRPVGGKGRGVFATRPWQMDGVVISARVIAKSEVRTMYSLQTGHDQHCHIDSPGSLVNHSCEPNLGIRDNAFGAYDFVALRPVAAGEELTFDYATTEFESIAVPECKCGADRCRGASLGYKYLTEADRARLTMVAGYILAGSRQPIP